MASRAWRWRHDGARKLHRRPSALPCACRPVVWLVLPPVWSGDAFLHSSRDRSNHDVLGDGARISVRRCDSDRLRSKEAAAQGRPKQCSELCEQGDTRTCRLGGRCDGMGRPCRSNSPAVHGLIIIFSPPSIQLEKTPSVPNATSQGHSGNPLSQKTSEIRHFPRERLEPGFSPSASHFARTILRLRSRLRSA